MSGFIIGLTGGVASGKSEVARRFQALGVHVADADLAAREVVEPGQPALARIAAHFGDAALRPDGRLDRRRLRERIFADAGERRALEAITHPAIRAALEAGCRAAPGPYAIAAIPLLAEAGGCTAYPWLDRILVVDAPVELQHARLMLRDGVDESLASRMIAAQAPRQARLAIADDVLLNDGHPDRLDTAVDMLHRRYLALAAAPP
ncbi:dephospho-CoA kinase [Pseudoxanthomonas broegbernensis]|uniref:Dephospho-CoA kinase n=1 Tax=Pseudoxanthomonas broegbernensis TaxID=83619 RepID=A0A7V8GLR8_9GAMM|nr:dephospho-CoA kinase [Pseudoxanthomonas broegbernensis]KAF1686023.1 dephospho-CoA kinase [Pseudoxanthomonas broegbernensis]MBB6063720.1 dephospho-CoA kinase [Pseudoxanthomonas broegbernensis]